MTKTLDPTCVTGFGDRLAAAIARVGNPVVVGLDLRGKNFPRLLKKANQRTLARAAGFMRSFAARSLTWSRIAWLGKTASGVFRTARSVGHAGAARPFGMLTNVA